MTLYRVTVQRTSTVYEDSTIEIEAETPKEALAEARRELDENGLEWREYHSDTEWEDYDWSVYHGWNTAALLTAEGRDEGGIMPCECNSPT